jgi:hypothetical protein
MKKSNPITSRKRLKAKRKGSLSHGLNSKKAAAMRTNAGFNPDSLSFFQTLAGPLPRGLLFFIYLGQEKALKKDNSNGICRRATG